eukprot:CFRG8662
MENESIVSLVYTTINRQRLSIYLACVPSASPTSMKLAKERRIELVHERKYYTQESTDEYLALKIILECNRSTCVHALSLITAGLMRHLTQPHYSICSLAVNTGHFPNYSLYSYCKHLIVRNSNTRHVLKRSVIGVRQFILMYPSTDHHLRAEHVINVLHPTHADFGFVLLCSYSVIGLRILN